MIDKTVASTCNMHVANRYCLFRFISSGKNYVVEIVLFQS